MLHKKVAFYYGCNETCLFLIKTKIYASNTNMYLHKNPCSTYHLLDYIYIYYYYCYQSIFFNRTYVMYKYIGFCFDKHCNFKLHTFMRVG